MRRLLIIALSAALCGCHPSSPLVGVWTTNENTTVIAGEYRMTFRGDGGFAAHGDFSGARGTRLIDDSKGTWKLEQNVLTLHYDDVQWTFPGEGPGVERAKARFAKNHDTVLATLNKDPKETLAWKGDDSFTMTDSKGKTETFQRAK